MSTMELDETVEQDPIGAASETPVADPSTVADVAAVSPTDPDVRTFRGRTLEELLPKIRAELGPDAVVVRQRDGLMGGLGGFFQQQFVEIEARVGHPRIDVYDEPPAAPEEGFAALLAAAEADAEPVVEARADSEPSAVMPPPAVEPTPVVEHEPTPTSSEAAAPTGNALTAAAAAVAAAAAAPEPAPAPEPAQIAPSPQAVAPARPKRQPARRPSRVSTAEHLVATLAAGGMSDLLAAQLVAEATAHELPFVGDGDLRTATIRALARRIPTPLPRRAGALALAFVGSADGGTTRASTALAAAYARAGLKAHTAATVAQAGTRLRRGTADALVVLDVPDVAGDEAAAVTQLAQQLAMLGLDDTQLVIPTTTSAEEALALHERLAPLGLTGITLVEAGGTSARIGAVVELACTTRLPLVYVLDGAGTIQLADPTAIAERLLP